MDRLCIECNSGIVGRADKKFCSDQCRTSYNNKSENRQSNPVRNINRILVQNRRILESVLGNKSEIEISRFSLLSRGYESSFCTHYFPLEEGRKRIACYDFVIEDLNESNWKIKRME